jgi:hypothetical protein
MAVYLFVIVLFLCSYYWLPPRLKDSPWTWLALFGGFATISVSLLSPKYHLTQQRVENRFQNRETALAWQGEEIESAQSIEAAKMPRDADGRQLLVPLEPIQMISLGCFCVGILGLMIRSMYPRRAQPESPSPPDAEL